MDWKKAAGSVPDQADGPSGFMKFKQGSNKFRILSEPLIGFEYWTKDNTPVRLREYPEVIPANIRIEQGKPPRINYFWAMVVYNLGDKRIQILELTQATIVGPIRDLINSEEYGDPRGYTLTVNRQGEGLETVYSVIPSPPKAVPEDILQDYKAAKINLEALFEGGNPFGGKDEAADVPFD